MRFLTEKLHPVVRDPALRLRVSLAANMANVVAQELRESLSSEDAECAALTELLASLGWEEADLREAEPAPDGVSVRARLSAAIRSGRLSAAQLNAALAQFKASSAERALRADPRFDPLAETDDPID